MSSGARQDDAAPAMDAAGWLERRRGEIENLLSARIALPAGMSDPGRLVEAMRYSALAPGKRLRPLLAVAAAEAAAGHMDGRMLLACASIELVHCYSLIHDDLPAMDDDDFRRGRASNHKVFGEATAILAGDALLTLAFEWIADAGAGASRPGEFLSASAALARGAGVLGMVRGQARDSEEPSPSDLAELEELHSEKTGALFRAALEIGAAVGGASPADREALVRFGTLYGIAFQHVDDLGDDDHPRFAPEARRRAEGLCREAIDAVRELGPRAAVFATLARDLLARVGDSRNDRPGPGSAREP